MRAVITQCQESHPLAHSFGREEFSFISCCNEMNGNHRLKQLSWIPFVLESCVHITMLIGFGGSFALFITVNNPIQIVPRWGIFYLLLSHIIVYAANTFLHCMLAASDLWPLCSQKRSSPMFVSLLYFSPPNLNVSTAWSKDTLKITMIAGSSGSIHQYIKKVYFQDIFLCIPVPHISHLINAHELNMIGAIFPRFDCFCLTDENWWKYLKNNH